MKQIYADPTCEQCQGVGVYWLEEKGAMTPCECHNRELRRLLTRKAGFPPKHIGCTVAGATGFVGTSKAELAAREAVIAWISAYRRGSKGLYLHGGVGTGKTHMMVAIGKALISQYAAEVLYTTGADLVAGAKASFGAAERGGASTSPFDIAIETPILLLDDAGAERPSEWVLSEFYRLINSRYNHNRTTIITSNLSLEDFEVVYDGRITDRIFEMCAPLHFDGKSRRRQAKS